MFARKVSFLWLGVFFVVWQVRDVILTHIAMTGVKSFFDPCVILSLVQFHGNFI